MVRSRQRGRGRLVVLAPKLRTLVPGQLLRMGVMIRPSIRYGHTDGVNINYLIYVEKFGEGDDWC